MKIRLVKVRLRASVAQIEVVEATINKRYI